MLWLTITTQLAAGAVFVCEIAAVEASDSENGKEARARDHPHPRSWSFLAIRGHVAVDGELEG